MENLQINHIAVHEVYKRTIAEGRVDPNLSDATIQLSQRAKQALQARIIGALGRASHSVELQLVNDGPNSTYSFSQSAVAGDEAAFIEASKGITNNLADAQTSRQIPGGVVVVFCGTINHPPENIVGIIKAEPNTGFIRDNDDEGNLTLTFIDNLFLTAQARLHKVGLYVFGAVNQVIVFDENISPRDKEAAAKYFYDSFLGCTFPQNNAKRTKEFYEYTKKFINTLEVNDDEKMDLHTALYSYLVVDQANTIHTTQFSNQFLPADHHDDYMGFMRGKQFPSNAIPKDLSNVQAQLKKRKLKFRSNIQLTAPAQAFTDLVTYHSEENDNGQSSTVITINDTLVAQS